MSRNEYSMGELSQCKEFDALKAVINFPNTQAYFDKLSEFAATWHDYLSLYNPTVVVYGEDVRTSFVSDMEDIRKVVEPLELTQVISKLDALDDMLRNNDAKGFADGLRVFYATLKIAANHIADALVLAKDTASPDSTLPSPEQPLILAVDDKPELLAAISSVLRTQYKVIAVASGNAALKAIEAHTPALFLLDIEMPGMDGYALAKKIREHDRFRRTPIVFLTSKATREHVINAVTHGGNDYLIKPVDSSLLLGKIQHQLNGAKI